MAHEALVERFFETLITGDRSTTRQVVDQARTQLGSPEALVSELFWPTHQLIERLYRADQLSRMNHHMAVRLMRQLVDQNAALMTFDYRQGKTVLAFCGSAENEELGAQMAVDLLEAGGYSVYFGGAGIAADEIMGRVNDEKPDVLLMFCSAASDLPEIRGIIDTLGEIGAAPGTQIAVGGGVFNRAEGLAEEIGADQWAVSPMELVELLLLEPERRAEQSQRTVGRIRRKAKAA